MTDQTRNDLPRIPFAPRFLEPIIQEEKDATLRLDAYDVQAGDRAVLVSDADPTEWAMVEIETTFTCRAADAPDILAHIGASHSTTKTERSASEVLEPHYDRPVGPTSFVQGLKWTIIEPFIT